MAKRQVSVGEVAELGSLGKSGQKAENLTHHLSRDEQYRLDLICKSVHLAFPVKQSYSRLDTCTLCRAALTRSRLPTEIRADHVTYSPRGRWRDDAHLVNARRGPEPCPVCCGKVVDQHPAHASVLFPSFPYPQQSTIIRPCQTTSRKSSVSHRAHAAVLVNSPY